MTNFARDKEVYLEPWMEIVGELRSFSSDDRYICLEIDEKTLSYRKDSVEGLYIQEKLKESFIGKQIAVLRTNIPEKPILINLGKGDAVE